MTLRSVVAALVALALAGCLAASLPPPKGPPPTRGIEGDVQDSVYAPVDRQAPPPRGYGLYTVLLTRSINPNTLKVLSELFVTTSNATDAAIARENLNLIMIPVKNASDAERVLRSARAQPGTTATELLNSNYDFGEAAKLMASLCRSDRGAAVMKACGSTPPDGPLLVTAVMPLSSSAADEKRLLVVNISQTNPGAIGEVLVSYRRQIQQKDWPNAPRTETWRLWALNQALGAASLLTELKKAYTENP